MSSLTRARSKSVHFIAANQLSTPTEFSCTDLQPQWSPVVSSVPASRTASATRVRRRRREGFAMTEERNSRKSLSSRLLRRASSMSLAAEDFLKWTLLTFHHLPDWMKDNEFLHSGHRPELNDLWECFRSIFMLHSETLNIWTHLLGFVAFVVLAIYSMLHPDLDNWQERTVYLFFFIGAIMCLGFSWIFHTVTCHSQPISLLFNKLDYIGISLLIFGSFIPYVYYAFYCQLWPKVVYMAAISVLSSGCMLLSLSDTFSRPQFRALRTGVFVLLGVSGVVPCVHHVLLEGFSRAVQHASLGWLGLMALLYLCGALIYALRIPECFCPGRFDIWFQSHQIFHVFVVGGAFVHFHGINGIAHYRVNVAPCSVVASSNWLMDYLLF